MANLKLKNPSGGSLNLVSADGASDLTVTFPATTGTAMVSGNMPTFSAYATGSQSISNATATKVLFQGEYWDTNNNFASSTFTPTVAGYYQVNAGIGYGVNTTGERQLAVYKNGSEWKRGTDTAPATAGPYELNVSCLVYCNGSTDYVEIYNYQNSGSSVNIGGGGGYIPATYFDGCMVRSA
jgi:hypothetical protein